jgi:molybdenum cofactor synthesis domain-containing protein
MLTTPEGALEIILGAVTPLPLIQTPLMESLGRRLAQDIRADRDQPPTDRSAMDGYAVRAADVRNVPARLEIVGEVAAGSPKQPAVAPPQVRDSNGPALRAALAASGHCADHHRIVPDSPEALLENLESAAAGHDVVLVTGGVSVGKYDLVPDAVRRIGGQVRFHGVSMKPGKPQLYASLDGNRHLFGLPGNPLSALTGFYELALPALRRLSGCPSEDCVRHMRLPLAKPFRAAKGNRTEFILARLRWNGGPAVEPVDSHGSADVVAAALADGVFAVAPGAGQYPEGIDVEFTPWNPAM